MNRERVQELRDVIAGIPEDQVDLSWPFVGVGNYESPPEPCGAVACIVGWAWIYPPFVKAGIRRNGEFGMIQCTYKFLDVSRDAYLFSSRKDSERSGTDKQVALRRLDRLLRNSSN